MRFTRWAWLSYATILALVIGAGFHAPLSGQSVRIEGGLGLGMSTTSNHNYILHGYLTGQHSLLTGIELGLDASLDLNDDRICDTGCGLEFPDVGGVALTIGVRRSRFALGAGPGLFYRDRTATDHVFAGGLVAHADIEAARFGRHSIVASIRPFFALGASDFGGDRLGLVPISIGVRW